MFDSQNTRAGGASETSHTCQCVILELKKEKVRGSRDRALSRANTKSESRETVSPPPPHCHGLGVTGDNFISLCAFTQILGSLLIKYDEHKEEYTQSVHRCSLFLPQISLESTFISGVLCCVFGRV